ncbi:DUF4158 domain-containing protein [Streptosporangium sp. NPDC051022]|uniref:DUF4158 domain-containing protein n=1 Tax=Streptosporangium sp. NPDC051022 TaxID=3155752 RepID=UPI003427C0C9
MGRQPVGMDELVEHWTVLDDEADLVAGKRGGTRLGFALLLKFYTRHGRFPRGRVDFPDEVVEFVARQMNVPAADSPSQAEPRRPARAHCLPRSGTAVPAHRTAALPCPRPPPPACAPPPRTAGPAPRSPGCAYPGNDGRSSSCSSRAHSESPVRELGGQ